MNTSRVPAWLLASVVVTAALSLWSISYRYRAEQRNKAISIAAEYETVEAFAAAEGKSVDQALLDLKAQGLGSVVLTEEYVGDLASSGRATFGPGGLSLPDVAATRFTRGAELRFPGALRGGTHDLGASWFETRISPSTLRTVAVGLDPIDAAAVRKAGLGIVARMANPPGVTGEYVRKTLDWAHELGASIFLPVGDQVLGRREALKDLTEELQKLGMLYASPEFTKLGGDENVLHAAPEQVIRLHSAQAAELDKLPLDEAVDRYSRAARERGMRVLLVRPVSYASPAPLASLADFVLRINKDCDRQGLAIGEAHGFEEPNVPTWLFLLIGLSLVPVAYFAGCAFMVDSKWRLAGLVLVATVGAMAALNHGRPYAALLAALAFPIAAFVVLDGRKSLNPVIDFVIVSLISLVGGLAVAGLLNGLPYFIRAEQFEGVKLAVFVPILLVALYFLMRGTDLKAALRNPMTWGAALIAILVLAALLFMSSRTGNDNPAGVSDLELKLRFLLDRILVVRPRTKEFAVGHPLLIVGIGLLALHRSRPSQTLAIWTALALAGGAIGQTDIVNTLCHIHTPITLSLMRIGVGMVAGCIIGLAVWAIVKRWLPAREA